MGLLQTILKGGKNIYAGLVSVGIKGVTEIAKATDLLLTKKEKKATKKEYYGNIISSTNIKSVKETLPKALTTAGGLTVVGATAALVTKSTASKVASGQIVKAAIAPVTAITGLSLAGSEKITEAVSKIPKATAAAAGEIAEAIDTSGKSLVGSTLTGLGIAVGGTAVGLGINELIKNKDQIVAETKGLIDTPIGDQSGTGSPILPETTSITAKKRTYKRRRAKKTPSVRQSVKINIINKPTNTGIRIQNKKYISERCF